MSSAGKHVREQVRMLQGFDVGRMPEKHPPQSAPQRPVFAAFPSFAALFPTSPRSGEPRYSSLLGCSPADAAQSVQAVRDAVARSGEHVDAEIHELLADRNWRVQVVGAVALLIAGLNRRRKAELWAAFDRGSWVSPQLAAVGHLIDPDFDARARERIDTVIERVRRDVESGIESVDDWLAKATMALVQLCEWRETAASWIRERTENEMLQRIAARDVDKGGFIAQHWANAVGELLPSVRRSKSSALAAACYRAMRGLEGEVLRFVDDMIDILAFATTIEARGHGRNAIEFIVGSDTSWIWMDLANSFFRSVCARLAVSFAVASGGSPMPYGGHVVAPMTIRHTVFDVEMTMKNNPGDTWFRLTAHPSEWDPVQSDLRPHGIRLRAHETWTVRRLGERNTWIAHSFQYSQRPPDQAPISVAFAVHPTDDSVDAFASQIMGRRVQQGYPERFDAEIAGATCLGFAWTDGILSIESYFVSVVPGEILEVSFAADPHQSPLGASPRAVYDALSGYVRIEQEQICRGS
ncbi:hypothetical protein LZC95_51440 [Pendulispora brunnea]|uniref:Uncharacterized protein n=1 Tax=Pendulispora brunnea TaxID=2905690 RepID=A0ABZ2KB94_9BACT